MAKRIYVGNLPYTVDEEALREVFAAIGEVQSVKIITDPAMGRSKGFGFVEMSSDEEADKAIASLNGSTLQERTLTVSEARPQTERGGRGGQRGGFNRGGGRKQGNWR
ncbi:MAG: RNA-binding protein [Nitrospirae bacterium]|nr:RNA-binding protein [Nitrospirota bacterium]